MVISVLMKLAGGSPSFAGELNIDAFLEQVGCLTALVLHAARPLNVGLLAALRRALTINALLEQVGGMTMCRWCLLTVQWCSTSSLHPDMPLSLQLISPQLAAPVVQARSYDEATNSPVGWYLRCVGLVAMTGRRLLCSVQHVQMLAACWCRLLPAVHFIAPC